MNSIEAKKRINEDPDFVNLKRFNYSLAQLLERYPEGCPDRVIAAALMIPETEVEEIYDTVVTKLRMIMGVSRSL